MDQLWAALEATWRILLVGILLGAGLPALFALGIRSLAWGTGVEGNGGEAVLVKPHLAGRIIAYLLFGLVILAVLAGVGYIVAHGLGYVVTFNGVVPTFSHK
ncbi:MAG: hypothetical protein K4304_06030 [Propionicimonas sp.]